MRIRINNTKNSVVAAQVFRRRGHNRILFYQLSPKYALHYTNNSITRKKKYNTKNRIKGNDLTVLNTVLQKMTAYVANTAKLWKTLVNIIIVIIEITVQFTM